ncbi:MAG: HepT-like ribonuclease domain-containing protein [Jatrophihabitantaceae bacterium]
MRPRTASRRLSGTEPGVPWGEIIGMRNWMAHRYFDTVHAYVWGTVDQDLGPLEEALDRLMLRLENS